MKNRSDLITSLNVGVLIFHVALLGIIFGNPFSELANTIVAFSISLFLCLFSIVIEKKTNKSVSGTIYHLVGCYSFLLTYLYLANTSLLNSINTPGLWSIFFLLLAILAVITSIRLKQYKFIYLSYVSLVLMFLCILMSFNLSPEFSIMLFTSTIAFLDLFIESSKKDKHHISSIISFILILIFILLLESSDILYISIASFVVLLASIFKIIKLNDEKEKKYLPIKSIVITYTFTSLIDNFYISVLISSIVSMLIYFITIKKTNTSNKFKNALYITIILCSLSNVTTINNSSGFDFNSIMYLYYAFYYFVGFLINKEIKLIRCISICLAILFAYNYLKDMLINESLISILNMSILFLLAFIVVNHMFDDDRNKDAFMGITLGATFFYQLDSELFLVFAYMILTSVIAIYISVSNKKYKVIKWIGIIFSVVGTLKLAGTLFEEIPTSIYLLFIGVIFAIYILNKLNDNKYYCKYCHKEITEGSKFCEHCGKKI